MRWRRVLRAAFRSLVTQRRRSVLALVSVGIGVAGVVVSSAVGAGAAGNVQREIAAMGVNLVVVRPTQMQARGLVARQAFNGVATSLSLGDFRAIDALPLVAAAAPVATAPVKVKAGNVAATTTLRGTSPAYRQVRRFRVARGRFFDEGDNLASRRVAVLGARVAAALFAADPVGAEIRIGTVPFDVIGVLAPKGVLADGDEDDQVLIPIRTALRRVLNVDWLSTVLVSTATPGATPRVTREIDALLRGRHRLGAEASADFEVEDATRFFTLQQKVLSSLRQLTTGLAVVGVLVGGTGIMGLMLLAVKQRRGEIGVRRAVGARSRDILIQFLMEASLLALGGWATGLALGAGVAAVIALATKWTLDVPVGALVGSLAMALGLGLGFGAVPARSAARIPPIFALLDR